MSPQLPSSKLSAPSVAVIGATGAVGREFIALFEQRKFPTTSLRLFASARSAGQSLKVGHRDFVIEELTEDALRGVDIALFSAGASTSRAFAPVAASHGAVVVDNSSAFRMDPGTPLVVPEVNAQALAPHRRLARAGVIANPNCSTIIMMVPLHPIRERFGIERIVASTYQAASGAGAAAMDELVTQSQASLAGRPSAPKVFHEPCAFNVFSHNSAVDPKTGRNVEEQKMIDEARKIWNDPALRVEATCVRVPVLRAHAEALTITLRAPATEAEFRAALAEAPGVRIVDDRAANRFPTPLGAAGQDDIFVGRIRPDSSQPSEGVEPVTGAPRHRGFSLFVCGDQLRKGAALNAVQIAELILAG